MTQRYLLGAAALGLAYAALARTRSGATKPEAFVATGASGEEGGARWEVFRATSGNWTYAVTIRRAGEADFGRIESEVEFAGLPQAVEAAREAVSRACESPVYDCGGEPAPKVQSASIGP